MTQLEELLASRWTLKAFESKAPGGGAQGQTTALSPETQRGVASVSVTGSQTGTDAGGHTRDLPSYTANVVTAPQGQVDEFDRAYRAGQDQGNRGVLDAIQARQFADQHAQSYGAHLEAAERAILAELYLAGLAGVAEGGQD
jgi:hypothetical protein